MCWHEDSVVSVRSCPPDRRAESRSPTGARHGGTVTEMKIAGHLTATRKVPAQTCTIETALRRLSRRRHSMLGAALPRDLGSPPGQPPGRYEPSSALGDTRRAVWALVTAVWRAGAQHRTWPARAIQMLAHAF
jgi:hypothetical protein